MWISSADSFFWRLSRGARADQSPKGRNASSAAGGRAGACRVSDRTRRRLVSSLRRLAHRRTSRDVARQRFEVLLDDRVQLVRDDLLEVAALLERASDPDPKCVRALHRLLTDGCESPLYNPAVHPSELSATLYYLRARLLDNA
jgi:hypothetical protein